MVLWWKEVYCSPEVGSELHSMTLSNFNICTLGVHFTFGCTLTLLLNTEKKDHGQEADTDQNLVSITGAVIGFHNAGNFPASLHQRDKCELALAGPYMAARFVLAFGLVLG